MWRRVILSTGLTTVLSAAVIAQVPTRQITPAAPAEQQQQQPQGAHVQGQIVRVDPQTSSLVVRIMDGNKAIDRTYKVETATTYWGADRKPFFDGLTNKNLKQGTDIWYRLGEGKKQDTITNFRLYNPESQPPPKTPAPEEQEVHFFGGGDSGIQLAISLPG